MKPKGTEHLHPVIDLKLVEIACSSAAIPSWHDAWRRLGPKSTHEDRLRVCQAIRDAGTLPEEAGYFLIAWAAEYLVEEELPRRSDPLQTLNTFEAVRAFDRGFLALLERHGEGRMADLFRTSLDDHDRCREVGRQFFFGLAETEVPGDAQWLKYLVGAVADSMVAPAPVGSLAFRYRQDGDWWEVHVCPFVDADHPAIPSWAVDIERLRQSFETIDGSGWYASPPDGETPYLWIDGEFDAHKVFLRLLQDAPDMAGTKGYETWRRFSK